MEKQKHVKKRRFGQQRNAPITPWDSRNNFLLKLLFENDELYFEQIFKECSKKKGYKNRSLIKNLLNDKEQLARNFNPLVTKEKRGKYEFYRITDEGKRKYFDLSFNSSTIDETLDIIGAIIKRIGTDPNYADKINDIQFIMQDLQKIKERANNLLKIVTKRFNDSFNVGS